MKLIIFKAIIIVAVIIFVIIQFFHPKENITETLSSDAIELHSNVPEEVSLLLRTSCYDCHSNNTIYPWYSKVQPISWWLSSHINDGRKHLNFDEFNAYSMKEKKKKFSEIIETLEKNEMPLKSYTLIHSNSKLSKVQKKTISDWATSSKENL